MWKKILLLVCTSLFLMGGGYAIAAEDKTGKGCTPTNIAYCKKNKTWSGEEYKTYTVRCSDSGQRTISYWKKRKQWCLGTKTKRCSGKRITTATIACRSRK